MSLELGDPLAHRALQALLRAEATVRKRVAAELNREGVSPAGFSVLVVLIIVADGLSDQTTTAGATPSVVAPAVGATTSASDSIPMPIRAMPSVATRSAPRARPSRAPHGETSIGPAVQKRLWRPTSTGLSPRTRPR